MPKSTFMNLKKSRQDKILEATVNEFSKNRYSEASINQIIKEAGIARGSFYQYFEGKEDLYDYMIGKMTEMKAEFLMGSGLVFEGDFFDVFIETTDVLIQYAKAQPKYYMIGVLLEKDESPELDKYRKFNKQAYQRFLMYIDKDKAEGLIRKDVDGLMLIDMLVGISRDTVLDMYMNTDADRESLIKRMKMMADVIRQGVKP